MTVPKDASSIVGGLEKGKAAHVKLQGYINSLIPEVDQPHSIIFDLLEVQERFQTRTAAIVNGNDYILISTDVDYTGYIHQTDDYESEPGCSYVPGRGIRLLANHRILFLEDDVSALKAMIYVESEHFHNPDIDEEQ